MTLPWLRITRLGLLLLALVLAAGLPAATVYTLEDGLSQNSVAAIVRDPAGFLWFGTEDGLNRFDGYEFRVYRHQPEIEDSLSGSFITSLQNEGASLWVGTEGGGLNHFDPVSARARVLRAGPEGLPNGSVTSLLRVAPGELWIGLRGAGLVRMRWTGDPATAQWSLSRMPLPDPQNPFPTIWAMHSGPSGLWLATQVGVFLLPADGSPARPLHDPGLPETSRMPVHEIMELAHGRLLLGSWDAGLFERPRADAPLRQIRHPFEDASRQALRTLALAAGEDGLLWVGTDRGLAWLPPDSARMVPMNPPAWADDAASGVLVHALLAEADGSVWAGSWGEGLARISANERHFQRIGVHQGLAQKRVRAVLPEPDGTLLVGSYGGGVQRFGAAEAAPVDLPFAATAPHTARLVWTLVREGEGSLVAGTDDGLYRFNAADGEWRSWTPTGWPQSPSGVRAMQPAAAGGWWIGTSAGLYRLMSDHTARRIETSTDEAMRAPDNNLACVLERANGDLLIGSWGGLVLRTAAGQLYNYRTGHGGLPASVVWSLAEDPTGGFWVGTAAGLVHAEGPPGALVLRRVSIAGVPTGPIYAIRHDRDGHLWLASNAGLYRFDPVRAQVEVYRQRDGLLSDEFHVGAHATDAAGRLYFGGIDGLVSFDPRSLQAINSPPRPVLTGLTQGNQSLPVRHQVRGPMLLELGHGRGPLGIDFSAIDGDRARSLRYRYRWLGLDQTWIELGQRRSVSLSALPVGEFQLEVQARSSTGQLGPVAQLLRLKVTPPWWQHPLLWAVAGLSLLAGAWLLARVRTAAIRDRNRWLSAQVEARTAELSRTAEALSQANARLQELSSRDGLTRLYNRRRLLELAPDDSVQSTCVLVDLDHFKSINDRFGHAAGDRVLIDFAQQIELSGLPARALAGRYGGEEFLIFLNHLDRFQGAQWAEGLRLRLHERQVEIEGAPAVTYSASFGVAEREPGEPLDAWIARADGALYTAKHHGRDRVEIAG